MWTRSRSGLRSLNRSLNRRCRRYAGKMLGGALRPRQPDELALLCRVLTQYLRVARRMEKRDPHLFGPRARDYFLDTLDMERLQQETEAALCKIYGPPPPDQPPRVSTLWTDRYYPQPRQRRLFLKWFNENYPSP